MTHRADGHSLALDEGVADEDGEYGHDLEQSTPSIEVVDFEMFVCSKGSDD